MRRMWLAGFVVVGVGLGRGPAVTAQVGQVASGASAPFGEQSLFGTPFAAATDRLLLRLETGPIGRHIKAHPADTLLVLQAMERIAAGDFSHADDFTLSGVLVLYRRTLDQVPETLCARGLGDASGDGFIAMLGAVDSAGAEGWATFFERTIASALTPGTRTPAATPEELRAAFTPVMLGLSPAEQALWLRQARAPGSLTVAERCQAARLIFRAIDEIPAVQRIGVLRATMVASPGS